MTTSKIGKRAAEAAYIEGLRAATSGEELEAAIQMPFPHRYRGAQWERISAARIAAGLAIVDRHPLGRFVPRLGARHALSLCGKRYKVGYGQNSTGVRYAWHAAGIWAMAILRAEGFSIRASHRLWGSSWGDYPHRSLRLVEAARAGKIPDPELNVLIRHKRYGSERPINYTVEANDSDVGDHRATRPCACGGRLFDWGAGFSEGFWYVNWHCNACPDVFTEYLNSEGIAALRAAARRPAAMEAAHG